MISGATVRFAALRLATSATFPSGSRSTVSGAALVAFSAVPSCVSFAIFVVSTAAPGIMWYLTGKSSKRVSEWMARGNVAA